MSVPDTVRHASRDVVFEEYPVLGFNYRMTDIQAAIGREQLEPAAGHRRATARAGARGTRMALGRMPGVAVPTRAGVGAQQLAELCRARSSAPTCGR